jgi:hypothetical protein
MSGMAGNSLHPDRDTTARTSVGDPHDGHAATAASHGMPHQEQR